MIPPFLNHDPQDTGPQYLEDLATGYWFAEVLFTAVEMEIFTLLNPSGATADDVAAMTGTSPQGMLRFLNALCSLGLLGCDGRVFFNTKISRDYLVKDREDYQGDSILWRKYLVTYWQSMKECLRKGGRVIYPSGEDRDLDRRVRGYIRAMDSVARTKVQEMLPIFEDLFEKGQMLDVGAGSGAIAAGFLEHFPSLGATLLDFPWALDHAKELLREKGLEGRAALLHANILEPWPVEKGSFELVVLSNIMHAYSEDEVPIILARASECLKYGGFLLIHDFFPEHHPQKAALTDLNMFVNTYNGRVFPERWVREKLKDLGLFDTGLIPLKTDTALLIASKNEKVLSSLHLDLIARLSSRIRGLGFRTARPIPAGAVHIPDWVDLRCRFGCDLHGRPHCPPNSPGPGKTRDLLKDYTRALLLEGDPPAGTFQRRVLQAEGVAFKEGFYKAFAFWAGPCALCDSCVADGPCRNTRDARPSMEGSGIDVYETVKRAGLSLRTLANRDDFVKYFALLLLE